MPFHLDFDENNRVEFLEDIAVVARATITHRLEGGFSVATTVVFDPPTARLIVESVTVTGDPGVEVTGAVLRTIRMQDPLRAVADELIFVRSPDTRRWLRFTGMTDYLEELAASRLTASERSSLAARIYAFASLVNDPPLKAVARILNISQSTATRLVAASREVEHG